MNQLHQHEPERAPITHRAQALLIMVGLTLVCTLPLIMSGNANGRGAADDFNYHWIAIQRFALEWPNPDLSDYASATTPGYHLVLAPLVGAGLGHMGAQLVALLWTLGFFGLLCWSASRYLGRLAAVICLPIVASMYTLYPGVWLLPDNAGWLLVLAIVLLALRDRTGVPIWIVSGILLLALVFVRQVHIWVAGTIWLSAWLGSDAGGPSDLRTFFSDTIARAGRSVIAIACTIPAFALLLWFLLMWGGLVPPMFQGMHQGPNPATPGFILLQLGVISVFFVPVLWPHFRRLWAHQWKWVLLCAGLGVLFALVPESAYSVDAGRYGGWWNIIKRSPSMGDRSLAYVGGAIFGAIALPVWLGLAPRRDAWVWVGTLVAFVAAQSANHASWQRYHEPLLLVMLVLIIARSRWLGEMRARIVGGVLALSVVFGLLTLVSIIRAEPVVPRENPLDTQAVAASTPLVP